VDKELAKDLVDKLMIATESWDKSVVVTTPSSTQILHDEGGDTFIVMRLYPTHTQTRSSATFHTFAVDAILEASMQDEGIRDVVFERLEHDTVTRATKAWKERPYADEA